MSRQRCCVDHSKRQWWLLCGAAAVSLTLPCHKNSLGANAFSATLTQSRRALSNLQPRSLAPRNDKQPFFMAFHSDNDEDGLFGNNNNSNDKYGREIRLREEAESPFRKVRFLVYFALLGGAVTSLLLSAARVAAALGGGVVGSSASDDLMLQESLVNIAVDLGGIAVLGFLYRRDWEAQESRLKRAAKGAELAKLAIRGTPALLQGAQNSRASSVGGQSYVTAPLSSLRRGRGIEKRVILAAAGRDKIIRVLEQARELGDLLLANDFVVVPIVLPQGTAPLGLEKVELLEQDSVALPAGGNWRSVVQDEAQQAEQQGVDVDKEGFAVVLKKNGRVGQRTKGIFLDRMCGQVANRKEMGLDVKNI